MRGGLIVTMLILAVLASAAASAEAASTRRLCARVATLRDSPEGFVIGRLYRPQRLRLQRRSANRRWALVATGGGVTGWVRSGSLCRA
jgi:phytoene/squalene synthetase